MTRTRFARWLRWGVLSSLLVLLAALPAPPPPPRSASPYPAVDARRAERGRQSLPPGLAPILAAALTRDGERTYAPAPLPGRADAFQSTNRAQHLTTTFLPAGLTLTSGDRAGGTTWGMRLAALGSARHLLPVAMVPPVLNGERVEYQRGGVTEWYRNSPLGLEQGMTLAASPGGEQRGDLVLVVDVTGAVVSEEESGAIALVLPGGGRLRYGNLMVTDARGQEVPARLVTAGGEIRIVVDDRGAVYPLAVDPLVQQARLTASDGAVDDFFGFSVAVSANGTTALVGARDKTIGGNSTQGAVYVFTRNGTAWSQQARLTASDGAAIDAFGDAVAVSSDGTTALIGAYQKMIGGNTFQGAAYVFTRSGTTWSQQQELTASDGAANVFFARSVALSRDGTIALVSADGKTVGTNSQQGAAYVFTRSGMTWSQQQEVTASDGAGGDSFGTSVALSGDGSIALVGAIYKTVGTNSNQGAVYVFTRTGLTWSQQQEVTASDGANNDTFGQAVALSGDGTTALIGASGKTIGANTFQGAAYIFTRSGITWSQQQEVTASDGAANDFFGYAVALSGGGSIALVGAYNKMIGGNTFQGAAYVYPRSGATWGPQQELAASDAAGGDEFGISVAVSGDSSTAFVGADSKTIGANGNEGAAYVYLQPPPNPLPPPQPTATVVPTRPHPLPVMHPTAVPVTNPTPLPLPPRRP